MKLLDLTEGRDAPLYHGTSIPNLLMMLIDNRMSGFMTSDVIGLQHTSIRFSRDINIAYNFAREGYDGDANMAGAIIQLDQTKLAQNYKIVPFADEGVGATRDLRAGESEEVVITTSIQPLTRYLTTLYVNASDLELVIGDISIQKQWVATHLLHIDSYGHLNVILRQLLNHPLRKDLPRQNSLGVVNAR